ncbi:hypothetical protein CCACVL1_00140, partial [Corchorus capsularis]
GVEERRSTTFGAPGSGSGSRRWRSERGDFQQPREKAD